MLVRRRLSCKHYSWERRASDQSKAKLTSTSIPRENYEFALGGLMDLGLAGRVATAAGLEAASVAFLGPECTSYSNRV